MDDYELMLNNKLKRLTSKNKLIFGFWISKRLFNNYVNFSKEFSFGDIDVLLDAYNLIEKYLKEEDVNINDIKKAITDVDTNTPDTNDFSIILVSFALDSCNSILECLEYMLDKDISRIVNIGLFAFDTVDMYVQEILDLDYNDSDFELQIQNHELMKKEIIAQELFLSKLEDIEVSTEDIIFENIIDLKLISDRSS